MQIQLTQPIKMQFPCMIKLTDVSYYWMANKCQIVERTMPLTKIVFKKFGKHDLKSVKNGCTPQGHPYVVSDTNHISLDCGGSITQLPLFKWLL